MNNQYKTKWDLDINGDTFEELKKDYNAVLQRTLLNMRSKESEYAEMTIKVKISLEKKEIMYGNAFKKDVYVPTFIHKVGSVLQIKNERVGCLKGDYELMWDDESKRYVMCNIPDAQMNLFEVAHQGDDYPYEDGV